MDYDPRYLAGIRHFNARDFFEAHEVWEDLWADVGTDRRFYQALIQAAVALFHFGNGNIRGAERLYHSSRDYMQPYFPRFAGLDVADFWRQMAICFAGILEPKADAPAILDENLIPTITLDPPPEEWPEMPQLPAEM